MELLDVLNHHLKGGEFEYKSFDFKKAKEEYEQTEEWINQLKEWERIKKTLYLGELKLNDKYQIPNDIREKHSYFRKGKLRRVQFSPTGSIYRIYIGAKYSIAIYESNLKDNLRLI